MSAGRVPALSRNAGRLTADYFAAAGKNASEAQSTALTAKNSAPTTHFSPLTPTRSPHHRPIRPVRGCRDGQGSCVSDEGFRDRIAMTVRASPVDIFQAFHEVALRPRDLVAAEPSPHADRIPASIRARNDESHSNIYRALVINPGAAVYLDDRRMYARNLEVPSGGGVATARGIAHAYGVFAAGGRELGLRQETLDLLAAAAIPPTRGFYDECLKGDGVKFSLGFMKSTPIWRFGSARSFGSPAPADHLALPIRRLASGTRM